jgi:hypothetical protein
MTNLLLLYTTFVAPNLVGIIFSINTVFGSCFVFDKFNQMYFPNAAVIAYKAELAATKVQLMANQEVIAQMSKLLKENSTHLVDQKGPTFYNLGGSSSSSLVTGCVCLLGVVAVIAILYSFSISNEEMTANLAEAVVKPLLSRDNELSKNNLEAVKEVTTKLADQIESIGKKVDLLDLRLSTFTSGLPQAMARAESNIRSDIDAVASNVGTTFSPLSSYDQNFRAISRVSNTDLSNDQVTSDGLAAFYNVREPNTPIYEID